MQFPQSLIFPGFPNPVSAIPAVAAVAGTTKKLSQTWSQGRRDHSRACGNSEPKSCEALLRLSRRNHGIVFKHTLVFGPWSRRVAGDPVGIPIDIDRPDEEVLADVLRSWEAVRDVEMGQPASPETVDAIRELSAAAVGSR